MQSGKKPPDSPLVGQPPRQGGEASIATRHRARSGTLRAETAQSALRGGINQASQVDRTWMRAMAGLRCLPPALRDGFRWEKPTGWEMAPFRFLLPALLLEPVRIQVAVPHHEANSHALLFER